MLGNIFSELVAAHCFGASNIEGNVQMLEAEMKGWYREHKVSKQLLMQLLFLLLLLLLLLLPLLLLCCCAGVARSTVSCRGH